MVDVQPRARNYGVTAVEDQRLGGVDRVAATGTHLEVEVGAGGVAGAADVTDLLAADDGRPTWTPMEFWWQYQISVPSARVSMVRLP